MFERGAGYLLRRTSEGFLWSLYEPGRFTEDSWLEPDADDTAVALTVLAGRISIPDRQLQELRIRFRHLLAPDGLYVTWFDGYHGEKGFVSDPNVPSLGVNLNILGFFGKYGFDRSRLLEALRARMQEEEYWKTTPYYRTLPVLAYLASNALEHGTPQARELLRRFLADLAMVEGPVSTLAPRLRNLDLAAYIKARSHLCSLDRDPCRDLDDAVRELAQRRNRDGSWYPSPFYEYDVNPRALVAFLDRRGFMIPREDGGVAFDVDRALSSSGTVRYYDGSPSETTSFVLKALVLYRDLIRNRERLPGPADPQ
jgi:hypothetical protein